MKCFYHRLDLDGHCSGAIVKMKYPECEMIGVDYHDELPVFGYGYNEEIYLVDFSFKPDVMKELSDRHILHWIDHHKGPINDARESGFLASGGQSLETGKAGCELTWEYLFPELATPVAVRLLGRYDVWDHKEDAVLPFQYGMRELEYTLPDSDIWETLFGSNFLAKKNRRARPNNSEL